MLILRIVGVLALVAIGASIFAFLLSRDRRYLTLAWNIGKYTLIFALVILSLFFLERVIPLG